MAHKKSSRKSARHTKVTRVSRIKKVSVTSKLHQKIPARLARQFMWVALSVLLASCLAWSILAAQIHQTNADQLIYSYLFSSRSVLRQATLPGAHTFLVKWPLFWLIHLLGGSSVVLQTVTVLISLLTVGGLGYVLYRINSRPLLFGLLVLSLASCLLLVPAQPYAGALLPVNLAMLATRNLEYIIYIGSLILLARANDKKSLSFGLAIVGLSLLFASDKLFMTLSIGGAIIALLVSLAMRHRGLVWLYVDWLAAGLMALLISTGLLSLVNHSGLVHISAQTDASPYGLIHHPSQLALGLLFGMTGLLTNFSANPAFDVTRVRDFPVQLRHHLFTSTGLVFVINLAIVGTLGYVSWRFLWSHIRHHKKTLVTDGPVKLSALLIWSSLAALAGFVLTNHYYAVDARYLAITIFTVFIVAATQLRKAPDFSKETAYATWVILMGTILLGMFALGHTHRSEAAALQNIQERNTFIGHALDSHKVDVLVGDYWRVIPFRAQNHKSQNVLPMDSCFIPRTNLSSASWRLDLKTHSFAYILSLDKSLTDYPACSLDQVIAQYGRPNASVLVAGGLENPKELLLFYDRGIRNSAPALALPKPSTILPIPIGQLPNTNCSGDKTMLQVVAHQDDDLLFMNPAIQHDIAAGNCVRTIYITAGDAGSNQPYWLARERGSQAAYGSMLKQPDTIWVQRTVKLTDNQFITIDNPRGNPRVSLIFLRLPDGNLRGEGFRSSRYESLAQLQIGNISLIHSVDKQSQYNRNDLISALVTLMDVYRPTTIRTQTTYSAGSEFPDHSDHLVVGLFTHQAFPLYGSAGTTLTDYIGYPIRQRIENVSGQDLIDKERAFAAYSQFDMSVCRTVAACEQTPTYGAYLHRQYTSN